MATDIEIVAEACRRVANLEGNPAVSITRVRSVMPSMVAEGNLRRAVSGDAETILRGMRHWRGLAANGPLDADEVSSVLLDGGFALPLSGRIEVDGAQHDFAPAGEIVATVRESLEGHRATACGLLIPMSVLLSPSGYLPALLAAVALQTDLARLGIAADPQALLGYSVTEFEAPSGDVRAVFDLWKGGGRGQTLSLDASLLAFVSWLESRGLDTSAARDIEMGLAFAAE